jgi:tRNA (guanine-N(7)-)-methyltransferase subunit TRM82
LPIPKKAARPPFSSSANGKHSTRDSSARRKLTSSSVPAVFGYKLSANRLQHIITIPTAGNPLDIATLHREASQSPDLILAIDPQVSAEGTAGASLVVMTKDAAGQSWSSACEKEALIVEGENIKLEELQKILYATENLRKTSDFE